MARNPQKGQRVVKEKEERKVDSARGSKRLKEGSKDAKRKKFNPGHRCIVLKSSLL